MIKTIGKMLHKGRLYYVEKNWKKKKTKRERNIGENFLVQQF